MFIKGNNLIERFRNLEFASSFSVGEIGFGVGLNFLTTCKTWLEHTSPDKTLNFFSFDKYLFKYEDFKEIISLQSELTEQAQELIRFYPDNVEGVQRISLFQGRVLLNLVIGDIENTKDYLSLSHSIDAWYLDGFSPSKNPKLWSENLLKTIHKTCHIDSTFSTYTSSGHVKTNLKIAGFKFFKVDGFSKKRHMLKGKVNTDLVKKNLIKGTIAVIGSGIAGCTLSQTLARKGYNVDLFEKSESICSGASDHELLVTYPKLSAHDTAYGRFNLQAFLFSTRFYDQLQSTSWNKTGVLILDHNEETLKKHQSLLEKRSDGSIYKSLNEKEVSELAGIELKHKGLLFKEAGYISPKEICEELIDSPNINLITSAEVEDLRRVENKTTFRIGSNIYEYEFLCLCAGSDTDSLIDLEGFSKKRGQVSHIESSEEFRKINLPICGKGYLSPRIGKLNVIGSSYSNLGDLEINYEEHLSNMEKLKVITDKEAVVVSGRVGFRAVSKDHLPIVGEMNGIFFNTCHGSRASVTAPISAEVIASLIGNEASPLGARELKALSPLRFN